MTLSEMSGAQFSSDRVYRQRLWRRWDESLPWLNVCGLNPSDANEHKNDPTVTRQIERAKRLGCGGLLMTNAHDLVSTDPRLLKTHPAPVSILANVSVINAAQEAVESCGYVLAAWGRNCSLRRQAELVHLLAGIPLKCLGVNSNGTPVHPLYQPYTGVLIDWPVTPE